MTPEQERRIVGAIDRLSELIQQHFAFSIQKDFYSTGEVSAQVKRGVWSIRQLCNKGKIRATKNGSNWKIPRSELETLLQKGVPSLD